MAEGLFNLGITRRDWVEETASDVVSLGELRYSKATANPVRIVVAVPADSPIERVEDLPAGVKVSSEYPELARGSSTSGGSTADIRLSYGATEAKVPDIVDCVVDLTETGRALRAAGLKIIDTILTSFTELVAHPTAHADPAKAHAMAQIRTLLEGVLEARGKVLVKLNVAGPTLDAVIDVLPVDEGPDRERAPRGCGLHGGGGGGEADHQHVDPRSLRPRAPPTSSSSDLEDRALMARVRRRLGTVATFDDPPRGSGRSAPTTVTSSRSTHGDRRRHPHHRRGGRGLLRGGGRAVRSVGGGRPAAGVSPARRVCPRGGPGSGAADGRGRLHLHEGHLEVGERLAPHRRFSPKRSPTASTSAARASIATFTASSSCGVGWERWIAASS